MKVENLDTSHRGKHGGTSNLQRVVDISPRFAGFRIIGWTEPVFRLELT